MSSTRATRRTPIIDPSLQPSALIKTSSTSSSKDKAKSKKLPSTVSFAEVIEISSDEDEPALPPRQHALQKRKAEVLGVNQTVANLEQQVKKLKEENAALSRKHACTEDELSRLRKEKEKVSTTQLDVADLEDHISCEICTLKLWAPYILPDCGHTFCQTCLMDWFSTTLVQHMAAHPTYNVNYRLPHQLQTIMITQPAMADIIRQQYGIPPSPQYTCPTCRASVTNRPIEDFSLKAVVRTVAKAQRETSPRKPQPSRSGRHAPANDGPWDGFFPKHR